MSTFTYIILFTNIAGFLIVKLGNVYPVIDIFAGPGGLGEGFASLRHPKDSSSYVFRTALSIEKDADAQRTLRLRHFFREFSPDTIPEDYYRYLEGSISLVELYSRHPEAANQSSQTAWLCTLGEEPRNNVRERIKTALNGHKKWALVGGPPCQAYSQAGRSRMKGNPDFEEDPRHFLYKQYLQIIIDHAPPVFVMENVKGLISSQLQGRYVINDILRDLSQPGLTVGNTSTGLEYKLYSLSHKGLMRLDANPSAFLVKAEEYGLPQARHRIFILGIRSDINIEPQTLQKSDKRITVKDIIGDLPEIRSSISGKYDSDSLWVENLEEVAHHSWFVSDAELSNIATGFLNSLKQKNLGKTSTIYEKPGTLKNWFFDEKITTLTSHEARSHMKSDLQRYFFASIYAHLRNTTPKLWDFPEELLPEHKNVKQDKVTYPFPDRFRVQLPNAPATTIMSHISKDGHYYIHYDPTQCRSLTVREAARIQTFPDNYKFEGNRTSQYHQVGNAVPPLLANKIAEIVLDILTRIDTNSL